MLRDDASTDERAFVASLSQTVPGKHLLEYYHCVNFLVTHPNRRVSAVEEAERFRRIFCSAYAKTEGCFGLPKPTPKFVAVVNLSGFRGVLYSNRATLIDMLCKTYADSDQAVIANVDRVLDYAARKGCPVLCCLSLPWQAGLHNLYWTIRSLERGNDGSLRDGSIFYANNADNVRAAGHTCETDRTDATVLAAQLAKMSRSFSTTNLDLIIDPEETLRSSNGTEREKKLSSVVACVRADRVRLLGDMERLRKEHSEQLREADRRADLAIEVLQQDLRTAEKALREVERDRDRFAKEADTARSSLNAAELVHSAEIAKMRSDVKVYEGNARSATRELNQLQSSATETAAATDRAHAAEVRSIERRLNDITLNLAKERTDVARLNREKACLDTVCEALRCEKAALACDNFSAKRRYLVLRVVLFMAKHKHEQARAEAVAAKMDAVNAVQDVENMQRRLDDLNAETQELREELVRAQDAQARTEADRVPTSRDVATETVPITTKTELELGELQTEHARVLEEKNKLADELERATSVHAQPPARQASPIPCSEGGVASLPPGTVCPQSVPPPVPHMFNHTVVAQPTPWGERPATDVEPPHSGNEPVDCLVAQMTSGICALGEMARQHHQSQHVVDRLWGELQATKRLLGADMGHAWPPHGAAGGYFGEMNGMGGMPMAAPAMDFAWRQSRASNNRRPGRTR